MTVFAMAFIEPIVEQLEVEPAAYSWKNDSNYVR
jgi:hypothetical protein